MARHQPPQAVTTEGRQAQQMSDVLGRLSALENKRGGVPAHAASAYRAAAASIGAGAFTLMPFDTLHFDTEKLFDFTNRCYTAPEAGVYHIDGNAALKLFNNPQIWTLSIMLNGVETLRGAHPILEGAGVVANTPYNMGVSGLLEVAAGAKIGLGTFNNGSNETAYEVAAGAVNNYMCVHRVA